MADPKVISSRWVKAAEAGAILPGKPAVVRIGDRRIAVFKLDLDPASMVGYCALEDACSHDDGPLAGGALEGGVIECPRHGARFDLKTGEALCMPAVTPVRTFPVRLSGKDVEVQIDF